MYKVFLVDDEIVVRNGIRDCINWEETNFVFSGEAPDGEFALSLIQEIKPDILITDIKMPFMDGLQLSRIVRRTMPWVRIIILTGHEEFSFAREALRMGVAEYLLKPAAPGDILESLKKMEFQLENEKRERENAEKIKKQLSQNSSLFRDKFLNQMLLGLLSPAEVIDNCAGFNINIISKFYMVGIIGIKIPNMDLSEGKYPEILRSETLIDEILDINDKVIKFNRVLGEIVLIIKGNNAKNTEEAAYALVQTLKCQMERNASCILEISMGSVRERIQGIAQSYREADLIKNYRYIYGKHRIIGYKDVRSAIGGKKEFTDIFKNDVYGFLKCGLKSDVRDFVRQYMDNLNRAEMKSLIYLYYSFMDLVLNVSRFISQLGGKAEQLIPWMADLENFITCVDSIEKFGELSEAVLNKVLEFRDARAEEKYEGIIIKAKEYMHNNLSNSGISLNSVASFVNVSPSHFSTIFSRETGENFIEYLTKARVKKAKELLKTTPLKSTEIAYSVGYNDPHYFCYIFKKAVGITPMEYRTERLINKK
ncbi:response regulator [Ruminiclostridium cellobioparum]|uniref:Stage 0 sporulation protein A homolog n=1 Tax=Ruminiclostridium cellobioparum subsp. termitidis CT1112 TaxID=1195236 RepID=S0FSW4_RUMCE|nr:response regulator [Ruminiclostridium cellobioparum]EMS72264.1 two component transcriptional regulator, AraC family protein [Ruminiclostridium cellobioparum subsp. termitidis CT1112]